MRLLTGAPLGGGSHATASNRQSSRSVALACFRVARAPPRRAGRGVWCRCERFSACRTSFELVPRRLCVVSDRSQRAGRPSGSFQVLLASLPTVLSVRNVIPVRSNGAGRQSRPIRARRPPLRLVPTGILEPSSPTTSTFEHFYVQIGQMLYVYYFGG